MRTTSKAKDRDGELLYVVEFFELQRAINATLLQIRKRDGVKVVREVAGRLVDSIGIDVEIAEGVAARRLRAG